MVIEAKETPQEKRKRLEKQLTAIKNLKTHYYIGTGEAWRYINAEKIAERNAQKLTDEVNKRLPVDARYRATPHTLALSLYVLKKSQENEFKEARKEAGLSYIELMDAIKKDKSEESQQFMYLDGITDPYYNLFFFTQSLVGISSPEDAAERLTKCFQTFMESLGEEVIKQEQKIREDYERKKVLNTKKERNILISATSIAKRVAHDRVEHRLEYVRQIAKLSAERLGAKTGQEAIDMAKRVSSSRYDMPSEIDPDDLEEEEFYSSLNSIILKEVFKVTQDKSKDEAKDLIVRSVKREKRWLDKILVE